MENFQNIFDNLNKNNLKKISYREHPTDIRRGFSLLSELNNYKKNIIFKENSNLKFDKLIDKYSLIIFTYFSTEFLNLLSLNKPCICLYKKEIIRNESIKNFEKLQNTEIIFTNGKKLAQKVNNIIDDPYKWWFKKSTMKIRKEFINNYSNNNFREELFINNLKNL